MEGPGGFKPTTISLRSLCSAGSSKSSQTVSSECSILINAFQRNINNDFLKKNKIKGCELASVNKISSLKMSV